MSARHSAAAQDLGPRSEMDADLEMDSDPDLEMGFDRGLDSTEGSGSGAGLDSVAVSDSADAGAVALVLDGVLASVGDGIHGGDGDTRTIHTRIGAHMEHTAGMTLRRHTVRT
jgi:hypothetical protein